MTEMTAEALLKWMDRPGPRDFRLVDVREADEYDICHLEGAELMPLSTFAQEAPARLSDKDETLVVYCHHGMRSQRAAQWLRGLGYEKVINLTGGINAWAESVDPDMARY